MKNTQPMNKRKTPVNRHFPGILKMMGLAVACLLMVLTGCQNPFQPSSEPSAAGDTGTLSLSIGRQDIARTITPETMNDFARFNLDFVPNWCSWNNAPYNTYWAENANDTIELAVGTWNLTVTALVQGPGGGPLVEAATGSLSNIVITGNEPTEGNVILAPIAGYTGTFRWNIGFNEASIVTARMEITRIHAFSDEPYGIFYFVGGTGEQVDADDYMELPTGQFRVTFVLTDNQGNPAALTAILHVYRYMESVFSETFTAAHFQVPLEDRILAAWDGIQWNLVAHGIAARHLYLVGIRGVDEGNFGYIVNRFNSLRATTPTPFGLADLKILTDAALIAIGSESQEFLSANYESQDEAEAAIAAFVRNGTTVTFNWTETSDTVVANIGGHAVEIVFPQAIARIIGWTVNFNSTITAIDFTFTEDPGLLEARDITITSEEGSATVGILTGSGTNRSLSISNVSTGNVQVSIDREGIASGPRWVWLFVPITWEATPVGYPVTTSIRFDFSADPAWLSVPSFRITSVTGSAFVSGVERQTLSYEVSLRNVGGGDVLISIDGHEIDSEPQTVTLVGPTFINWTVEQSGYFLMINFDSDPGEELIATDITITEGAGRAFSNEISGTETTRALRISNIRAGDVSVFIDSAGIMSGPRTVNLVMPGALTWTAEPVGYPVTTSINLNFSAHLGSLDPRNITIASVDGSATAGALTGSGATRSLAISNVGGGDVLVSIAMDGIDSEPRRVTLVGPTLINWTVEQNGNTLVFEFDSDPGEGMIGGDITITAGTGSAWWGHWTALFGTGTTRILPISDINAGNVLVSINRAGIVRGLRTVNLTVPGEITWEAEPVGDPVTTSISLDFSASPGSLNANNFTITSVTGSAVVSNVSQWPNAELTLSSVGGGDVLISINIAGVDSEPRRVTLVGPSFINWTAEQAGSFITFNFDSDPGQELAAADILITAGTGSVMNRWTLLGTGTTRALEISNINAGDVSVSIGRTGIVRGPRTVNIVVPPEITWTAEPVGTPVTTSINFTFSEDPGWLEAGNITIASAIGTATRGTLSGSGTTWSLTVSGVRAGDVSVSINDHPTIPSAPQPVTLVAPDITWTAEPVGRPTNAINFVFGSDPGALEAEHFTIGGGPGAATRGTLSGWGNTRTLAVSDVTAGNVSVSISRPGIASGPQTVALFVPLPLEGNATASITGTAQVGETLTANVVGGSGTISFQWLRNGNVISNATGNTRVLALADQGAMISVRVSRADYTGHIYSQPVGPIAAQPQLTGSVTIQGTPQVGQQLMAQTGGLIGGAGTDSFQWRAGNTNVGTNSWTFTPTAAHVGQTITVTVTRAGHTGSVTSPATSPVAAAPGIGWSANPVAAAQTTTITLGFVGDPGTVTAANVSITNVTGSATIASTGTLPGTGMIRTLTIANATQGEILITINRDGISNAPRSANLTGPPTPPSVFPVADITITVTGIPSTFVGGAATMTLMIPQTTNHTATASNHITSTTTFSLRASPAGYVLDLNLVYLSEIHRFRTGVINIRAGDNTIPWSAFNPVP